MMMRKLIISFASLVLLSCIGWLVYTTLHRPTPDVIFKTIKNRDIALQDLRGQPVLINFWATDCPACLKEIPHLKALHHRYHKHGLEIIAVSMFYDPPSRVVAMSRAKNIPYNLALDLQGKHSLAFGHIRATPTTFLISPEGRIVYQTTGMFNVNTIETYLDKFLTS